MGAACCDGDNRPKDGSGVDVTTEEPFSIHKKESNSDLVRKYSVLRTEVNHLPISNNKVEENIKKLSKFEPSSNKIWKIKHPVNIIYTNREPAFEN